MNQAYVYRLSEPVTAWLNSEHYTEKRARSVPGNLPRKTVPQYREPGARRYYDPGPMVNLVNMERTRIRTKYSFVPMSAA